MDAELLFQQVRIYQNKTRPPVTIPYAETYHFFNSLDNYVREGRHVRITFPVDRLEADSYLIDRIMMCHNGLEFLKTLEENKEPLGDILDMLSADKLTAEYYDFIPGMSIYTSYQVGYEYDSEYQQYFFFLEPMGEGIRSWSFTVE